MIITSGGVSMKNENSEEPKENKEEDKRVSDNIFDAGSVITGDREHVIYCLTIIGQIEGHTVLPSQDKTTKYEHVIPRLVAIEKDPGIDGLLVILNTVGGDVEAGLALSELIAGMTKPTVSLVLGGGHSIGAPLAVSAKHSFIVPSATITIHPVRMTGLTLGVPQTLDYFERMQKRITEFITQHSKISAGRLRELLFNTKELVLDIGSVLDGADAVKEGLIDSIGSLSDAMDCLYGMIDDGRKKKNKKSSPEKKTVKSRQ